MKKIKLFITSCLIASSLGAMAADYTKGLSIWFDKPNDLKNY